MGFLLSPFSGGIGRRWRDRQYPGTTEINVVKGYCTPARMHITAIAEQYHIEIIDQAETPMGPPEAPSHVDAYVRVKDNQAGWMEYLLLRSQIFDVTSPLVNPRNAEWAGQHRGKMPTAWDTLKGERWIEKGCTSKGAAEYQRKKAKAKPQAVEEPVPRSRYARERTRPARTKRTRSRT